MVREDLIASAVSLSEIIPELQRNTNDIRFLVSQKQYRASMLHEEGLIMNSTICSSPESLCCILTTREAQSFSSVKEPYTGRGGSCYSKGWRRTLQ